MINLSNFKPMDDIIRKFGAWLLMIMPLVALLNPWEVAILYGLSIRVIDLIFLLSLNTGILHILFYGKLRRNVLIFLVLVIFIYLITLLGLMVVPDYQVAWPPLFRFTQTILWGGLALLFIKSKKEFKIIIRNIIFAGDILSVFSVYLYMTNKGLHRIAGFFSAAGGEGLGRQASYNEIGAIYTLAILLSLYCLFWDSGYLWKRENIKFYVGFILNLIGLILVQSRSAIFALFVGCIVLVFPRLKRIFIHGIITKSTIKYMNIILMTIFIIIVGTTYIIRINRLSATFIKGSSEYISAITRIALWIKSINIWLDGILNFLLGYGFRTTDRFLGVASAHNFFLNISLWLGLLGLFPILFIIVWPILKIRKNKDLETIPIASITTSIAFIVSIFGNVLVDPFYGGTTFLLLYAAMAVSNSKKYRGY